MIVKDFPRWAALDRLILSLGSYALTPWGTYAWYVRRGAEPACYTLLHPVAVHRGIDQNVAFYPRGYHFKKAYAAELVGYETPKGAIYFPSNAALPSELITKIVKDRARENRLVAQPLPAGFPEKLAAPVKRALAAAEISSLETLASYSEEEILALHGVGPKDLPLLRSALQTVGRDFRRDEQP